MPLSPRLWTFLAVFFFFLFLPPYAALASGTTPKLPNPGFRSLGLWDENKAMRLNIAVWYPTYRAMRDIEIGGWSFRAGKDGAPVAGLYPVILLSHNAASSRLGSHDLAAYLAQHGFVVIAPTHTGDNDNNTSAFFHAENFAARPNHLILALEKAYTVPALAAVMDRSRIGLLGVGSGAATVLQLAGALPDLSRLKNYCSEDTPLDPLCSNWAHLFHKTMEQEFTMLMAKEPARFSPHFEKTSPLPATNPPNGQAAPAAQPEPPSAPDIADPANPEKTTAAPQADAPGMQPSPEKQPVLAVGLLTPGMLDLFPDESFANITAQIGIFAVMNDSVYASGKSSERLQTLLSQRSATKILHNENFFDVQAPCPPASLDTFPALCGGQTISAQGARKKRNDFFTRFYQKTLGLPAPQPTPVSAR